MDCSMLLGIIILLELGTGEPLSINQPVSWVCIDKDPTSLLSYDSRDRSRDMSQLQTIQGQSLVDAPVISG